MLLVLVGVTDGVGVGVEAGVVDGVGVGVAPARDVGAGETGADGVGPVPVPGCVVGQPPDPRPPLPGELPPVVSSCGAGVTEAVGVAVPLPPGEAAALVGGATGSQDRQGAGPSVTPGLAADPDGPAVRRTRGEVLADAPLTTPPPRPWPPAVPGPAPRLGASA